VVRIFVNARPCIDLLLPWGDHFSSNRGEQGNSDAKAAIGSTLKKIARHRKTPTSAGSAVRLTAY
jgi:hypothetical protein